MVARSAPSLVPVEAVVTGPSHCRVAHGNGTAEEFHTVVLVRDDLDVVDGGARADAREGEAVDFVVRCERRSTVADADVAQDAGVVGIVRAAVLCAVVVRRDAFDLAVRGGKVRGSRTEDDEAAPLV